MPIPTSTANAAISIVSGLVRLTGRIDNIMAEQAALRDDLALPGKVLVSPPLASVMCRELRSSLEETASRVPDPLGGRRAELAELLEQRNPEENALLRWMEELLPEKVEYRIEDPSGSFAAKLRARRSAWDLDDEEIRRLAYYLGPGEDLREAKLPWQLATTVVGVLSEVAIENQALIFRDDRARPILVAVLTRFAEPDLATVGSHRALLRFVLKATMNGALDAADALRGDKAWVEGILSALAKARESSDIGDDFVVGLVQGRGYPELIGSLLKEGADFLSSSDAGSFGAVAADVFTHASVLVRDHPDFEQFFRDHWGDLLRAALSSLHTNGGAILADGQPLLRQTLLASIEVLAKTTNRDFLNSQTLTAVFEAVLGAISTKPELLDDAVREKWLREVLGSTASVIANEGFRRTFSAAGLQTLMQTLLAGFAQHPELLATQPGLAQDVAGSMLSALASSDRPRLDTIASAGIQAVLTALVDNPVLVNTDYPALVAAVAGQLTLKLGDARLTRGEATEILAHVATTIAANPTLLGMDPPEVPAAIVAEVLSTVADHRPSLLTSTTCKDLVGAALGVVAADPQVLSGQPQGIGAAAAPVLEEVSVLLSGSALGADLSVAKVAHAGVLGVLAAVAQDSALLDSRYPAAVAKVARAVAERLRDGKLTIGGAERMVTSAAAIIATNPRLFQKEEDQLAARTAGAVLDELLTDETVRVRGLGLADLLAETLAILAAHGLAVLDGGSVDALVTRVQAVLKAGLEKANTELGRMLDRGTAPLVLAALLRRWALGQVETLDIDDARFESLFAEIVSAVSTRTA